MMLYGIQSANFKKKSLKGFELRLEVRSGWGGHDLLEVLRSHHQPVGILAGRGLVRVELTRMAPRKEALLQRASEQLRQRFRRAMASLCMPRKTSMAGFNQQKNVGLTIKNWDLT